MGAGFSNFLESTGINPAINGELASSPGLGDLPESCIALILTRLHPSEVCKVARVNKTFHQASLSDLVWKSRLPENHQILVNKLLTDHRPLSKKETYARLTHPLRFASHTKVRYMHFNYYSIGRYTTIRCLVNVTIILHTTYVVYNRRFTVTMLFSYVLNIVAGSLVGRE